jgi:hypothetical protein
MEAAAGGVDDMTKLSYLHEPGVLQNLAIRYELNEIYVCFLSTVCCLGTCCRPVVGRYVVMSAVLSGLKV